ncbi:hypothetical protein B0H15DRAFT_956667 [Mycena belliarum]|uniref:Uncharacterized protein n=1 Tax=Mycena belliarum TaxID=1033014 RepID=A0AAD6TU48_9AGAR|nr:hypothetical protein B0H15DRAFT_956667 [Mycena belliae]
MQTDDVLNPAQLYYVASVVSQRSSDAAVAQPSAAVGVKPASLTLPAAPACPNNEPAPSPMSPPLDNRARASALAARDRLALPERALAPLLPLESRLAHSSWTTPSAAPSAAPHRAHVRSRMPPVLADALPRRREPPRVFGYAGPSSFGVARLPKCARKLGSSPTRSVPTSRKTRAQRPTSELGGGRRSERSSRAPLCRAVESQRGCGAHLPPAAAAAAVRNANPCPPAPTTSDCRAPLV